MHLYTKALGAWLLLVLLGVRAALGVRSMVRGSQARDVARGTNTLQGLQSMWHKDSQEEERAIALNPKKTWEAFILNSNRQKRLRLNKRKKAHRNQIPLPKEGPVGPPGRRGPQGPAGAPGGTLTTLEMEEYIKDFLRDYLQRNHTINPSYLESQEVPQRSAKSKIKAAFNAILPEPAILKRAGLSVIDSFTIPFWPGVFERRMVMENGGFTVIKKGIYQVAASLVLHPRRRSSGPSHRHARDVSVYLCITNCTQTSRRLEWAGALGEGTVTAVLAGHVQLTRGDTLLLAVNNPTKRPLQVGTGSSFSAALIGT